MDKEAITKPLLRERRGDGEAFENVEPVTLAVAFSAFTALCGTFSNGTAAGFTSPAQSGIMSKLNLSLEEFSFFGSVLTIGGIVGAAFCGSLTDFVGRKGALWVSNTFCIMGWLAIYFSKAAWSLDLGRLSLGIGSGIVSYVVPVYIVEIAPRSIRGTFTAVNTLVMCSAVSLTYLIGSVISWRTLALISMVPCLVEFVALIFIPESPRWLARKDRVKESEAALQHLRGKHTDITEEAAEIKNYMDNLHQFKEDGFFEMFHRRYARTIVVAIGLLVLQQLGGLSGYTFYMSSIFQKAGFPSNIGTVVATAVQFATNIIGLLIIDRFGRRPLLTVGTMAMCLASVLTGSAFLLLHYNLWSEVGRVLALVGVLVFLTSLSIGIGGIPWVMVSEITPINIKGSVGTLANLVSWASYWLVSYSFNFLFQWSTSGVFFIYASISALGVIFVAKLVPETKGRRLEEIQASITR